MAAIPTAPRRGPAGVEMKYFILHRFRIEIGRRIDDPGGRDPRDARIGRRVGTARVGILVAVGGASRFPIRGEDRGGFAVRRFGTGRTWDRRFG